MLLMWNWPSKLLMLCECMRRYSLLKERYKSKSATQRRYGPCWRKQTSSTILNYLYSHTLLCIINMMIPNNCCLLLMHCLHYINKLLQKHHKWWPLQFNATRYTKRKTGFDNGSLRLKNKLVNKQSSKKSYRLGRQN